MSKSAFLMEEIEYLGHLVSRGTIKPLPSKVAALSALTGPVDVPGLRRLIGLFGYYQKFIPNFSKTAASLFAKLNKGVEFSWTDEDQAALGTLKEALIGVSLEIPEDWSTLVIQTDASDVAVAAGLYVQGEDRALRPVGFASKILNGAELNWPTSIALQDSPPRSQSFGTVSVLRQRVLS
eukprot:GHVP01000710.1.p1 GENE.GHVP01000710.1~~GHVP01000710.1.p1  ORF type:complete len:180 (-),score=15.87 GHVP01000710.1:814-1353(-)